MPSLVIPDAVLNELADLREQIHPDTKKRWTYRQLSEWLATNKGIVASHAAVHRALRPLRETRDAIAREATREKIYARLNRQVGSLDSLMRAARSLVLTPSGKPKGDLDPEIVLDTLDGYRKAVETKLKFSGVGERVEVDAEVEHREAPPEPGDPRWQELQREHLGGARQGVSDARPHGDADRVAAK